MTVRWVYMTTGSTEEAEQIGGELVKNGIAACVNMIDGMRSLYVWEGALQQDREVILIAKTTAERMPDLVETVNRLHSYDCPCILGLPVDGGNLEFIDWIRGSVKKNAD